MMMIGEKVNKFTESFKFLPEIPTQTQKDIMVFIHQQFQNPSIKKLYFNPVWTERIFWIIHGNVSQVYEDLSVDLIIDYIERYSKNHGYPTITNKNILGEK